MIAELERINQITQNIRKRNNLKQKMSLAGPIKVGIDLGTHSVVLVILDNENRPVYYRTIYAEIVRDGLIVDYLGAIELLRKLKKEAEDETGTIIKYAATAMPPGVSPEDCKTYKYVIEAIDIEVTSMIEEPVAANSFLGIKDGVVVDIGGGTTGIALFKNGEILFTADEPSGGKHLSLVLMGNRKISFEESELFKQDQKKSKEVLVIVKPVIEKFASIIKKYISRYKVDYVYLVGGTSCLNGIEHIIEKELNIPVFKPLDPFLITPIGIAMHC